MEKSIIAFIGVQGSGKTYSAISCLEDGWNLDSKILSFADPVYLMARHMVSSQLTEDLYSDNAEFKKTEFTINGIKMTGRQILQMIGEGARLTNSRVWIDKLLDTASETFKEEEEDWDSFDILIDDCRYPNEVLALIDYAKNNDCEIRFVHCTHKLTPGQGIPGEHMANYFCTHEFSYENLVKYCMENE